MTMTADASSVLVVEDDSLIRMLIAEALSDAGFEVIEAADGQYAIEILEGLDIPLTALVTDIQMPRAGGLDVTKVARGRWPDVPVVIASGAPGAQSIAEIVPSAVFIPKPFDPAQVVAAVESVTNLSK